MYDDTFCVRIAVDHSLGIGFIHIKPKSSRESIYFMDLNESALFVETLEKALQPVDCYSFDNFIDNSLRHNYCICNAETHMQITIKGKHDYFKKNFNMSYETCQNLIKSIRDKLDILKENQVGTCVFCNSMIYQDNTRYIQADGTVVHGYCMEKFISSDKTDEVELPVQVIKPIDCFGFIGRYGESYRRSFFPQRRTEF